MLATSSIKTGASRHFQGSIQTDIPRWPAIAVLSNFISCIDVSITLFDLMALWAPADVVPRQSVPVLFNVGPPKAFSFKLGLYFLSRIAVHAGQRKRNV